MPEREVGVVESSEDEMDDCWAAGACAWHRVPQRWQIDRARLMLACVVRAVSSTISRRKESRNLAAIMAFGSLVIVICG